MRSQLQESAHILLDGPFGTPEALLCDRAIYLDGVADIVRHHTGADLLPTGGPVSRIVGRACLQRAVSALLANPRAADQQALGAAARAGQSLLDHHANPASAKPRAPELELLAPDSSAGFAYLMETVKAQISPSITAAPVGEHWHDIQAAVDLAHTAVGDVATSTFRFIDAALVIGTAPIESAYLAALPGLVLLNITSLGDTPYLAELLLHEACHQKFLDILTCRKATPSDYDRAVAARFSLPWNPVNGARRTMDPLRLLSTLHVYIHLILLTLELHARTRDPALASKAGDYLARADFFGTCLTSTVARAQIAPGGSAIADWMQQVLLLHHHSADQLGIDCPDTYVHDARTQIGTTDA